MYKPCSVTAESFWIQGTAAAAASRSIFAAVFAVSAKASASSATAQTDKRGELPRSTSPDDAMGGEVDIFKSCTCE